MRAEPCTPKSVSALNNRRMPSSKATAAELLFGETEVLAPAKQSGGQTWPSTRDEATRSPIIHMMFDQHENRLAEGGWPPEKLPPWIAGHGTPIHDAAREELFAIFSRNYA